MAGPVEIVDATAFLGMHAVDDATRIACKTFFASRNPHETVLMSLEHIGWCDDVVWGHPRPLQDAYYPFMDTLHSEMAIRRVGYDEPDIEAALGTAELTDLPMRERLLMGMVLRRDAVLRTASPRLVARRDLPVASVPPASEQPFSEHLEQLYRASLALRIPIELM